MNIRSFRFVVEPWSYINPVDPNTERRSLTVTVDVDGKQILSQCVLPNIQPFETEIEFFSRRAISMLQDVMRQKSLKDKAASG